MGLGIIPEVIVDQHFHNRNRMARLMSAVAAHPERLGIGIDEDTCAMFERDGMLRFAGRRMASGWATRSSSSDVRFPLSGWGLARPGLTVARRFGLGSSASGKRVIRVSVSRPLHLTS